MRDFNTSLVVNLVKTAGPLSRAELARQSGLSPATVSGIVARLLRADILSEVAQGASSGGRPPVLVDVNEHAGNVIGIKVKEHGLTTVITNLNADVLYSSEAPCAPIGDPAAAIHAITVEVKRALTATDVKKRKVLGVGVGVPGMIDVAAGVCRSSPMLRWTNIPLQEPLRQQLKLPVWVDNDVNTLAVADKWLGAGADARHFMTVTVGRGIGLGVVLNGEVYRGAIGGAGEFGHTIVDPVGPLCDCGRRGCLETLVSEPALRAQASGALGRQLTTAELLALADQHDPVVAGILTAAAKMLGLALANLVTVLNPEKIILGGEGTRLGPVFLDPLVENIRGLALPEVAGSLDVVIENWGDEAWAVGAATFVLRELFKLPEAGQRRNLVQLVSA